MNQITKEDIAESIRDIPDFPKKGILFKDLTTAFKKPEILRAISNDLFEYYSSSGITKVVGIESRGFIAGSVLASRLGAGFVPVRKPGKLPADTYAYEYDLEYGSDIVEIHKDALETNDIVLLHDDLLATGGTACAALELLKKFKVRKVMINFIVELSFLKGRDSIGDGYDIYSMITF
jgi:adenine phosphoribosyltransferase